MVDSEILDGGKDLVRDIDAAAKVSSEAAAGQPKYAVAGTERIRSSLEKSTVAVSRANAAGTSSAAEARNTIPAVESTSARAGDSGTASVEGRRRITTAAEALDAVTTVPA